MGGSLQGDLAAHGSTVIAASTSGEVAERDRRSLGWSLDLRSLSLSPLSNRPGGAPSVAEGSLNARRTQTGTPRRDGVCGVPGGLTQRSVKASFTSSPSFLALALSWSA